MIWLLEKYKYDYTSDQVLQLLNMIKDYHLIFVKDNQFKIKLDNFMQHFIAE